MNGLLKEVIHVQATGYNGAHMVYQHLKNLNFRILLPNRLYPPVHLGVPDVQVFLTEARSNKKRVPCLTATKKGLKTLLSFYITKSVNARVCKRKRVDFLGLFTYLWFGVHNYFLLALLSEKVMLDLMRIFFRKSSDKHFRQ